MQISELPRKIIVERGAIQKIKEVAGGFGSKFLVVVDAGTEGIGGKRIAEGLGCRTFVIKDSTLEEVKRVEKENADCIVSFGGGKVLDVGKLAAFNKGVHFVSCPTACSNDGIASKTASITANGKKESFTAASPDAIVADLDILIKAPYRLTASGAADVVSNYTAVEDWRLAVKTGEEYSESIAGLSLMAADLVCKSAKSIRNMEENGIKNLVWGLIFSGATASLFGSSRPASGAEHIFSHALDSLGSKGLHGEQVGVGTIFFSYLQGKEWGRIKKVLGDVGAPTTAKGIGVGKDLFVQAMLMAKDIRKRYTILDEKPLDRELVIKIAGETGIF